ncbi:class I SAM-dependent methyltransferase [Mycolicibacterium smegmatis]|jgi:methyltransferase (TIGR00027 family)|uniref:Putative S-adenosyl-L-methionine-dependent methyltransferase MSMEG_1482/MSMEI_1446 n=4 Tax=Mycobacteriales TaxID=85007 RepID=Y1482_MYCS2|nr:class I SAM-dependent methyltransferase [Mycolicibacterium smegmatis]A0QSH6.1 RecName: Full=Putative S-adenosyl-L-methionine-dependent methyltransferase MSMEG_1482/MSMEI_1446 [Mycolicibacterium smegmatis MC2 155]ABK70915.1 methyltransferase [Mycolicibacterium smegmatis MC2 155]AFP37919.1 O-methyltransferase [Mycolicibacterium smegmatis MC2 155]AIU06717.1 SAM-dependent methyltransferase [Mycolicibacterium smegmatis MC2 155]AIU13342.1 SAM-dependent methyltransferase [Mycolicibacterium smegmat
MARTENDTWDLASSVGATATMVAAARALATNADEPAIDDPFAAPLVRAVGVDFFTKLVDDNFDLTALDPEAAEGLTRFANGMAARTRFFDDFFLDAARAGVRQFVILASGLDARAYRLPWPAGSVVFEIDQPDVIEFKTKALADLGALPTTDRRAVAVDLRFDWPAALTEAGFDPAEPTAWIAEGLLGYLPPEAQDRLLDQIAELSAPGSRVAVEEIPAIEEEDHEEIAARMKDFSDRWRAHGFDLDFTELVFLGDRADVSSYLQGHGWKTTSMTSDELLVHNGLPRVDDDAQIGSVVYVTATR